MKRVSIIILSYNASELLKTCLTSVYRHSDPRETEVIVVDNASQDNNVEVVKKNFSKVTLIENTSNVGFAKGCNLGAKYAKGDYFLFLNSDAEFLQNPLPEMVKTFEEFPHAGIVGGLLYNPNGSLQRSFGKFYTLERVGVMLFGGDSAELKRYHSTTISETDWVSGGFMMIRKDVFEKVNGFNESYFMYIEDMDLCYRVKKLGFQVLINPRVSVKHLGQGSSNKTFAIVHIYKGLQIFYKQQKNVLEYFILKLMLFIKAIVAVGMGILTVNRSLVRTYWRAIRTL